jgi:hypothetical protein
LTAEPAPDSTPEAAAPRPEKTLVTITPGRTTIAVGVTLAVAAVLDVLAWPVAAAVGAGWLGAKLWGARPEHQP